ncbi:MAG: hypothetical protein IK117_09290 [Bacteroidales bacterium]|nr:hypothetical protein [Bacteroidales bacterium]
MNKKVFPKITTVVEAEPWQDKHVARITSFRAVTKTSRQTKNIEAKVLPQ